MEHYEAQAEIETRDAEARLASDRDADTSGEYDGARELNLLGLTPEEIAASEAKGQRIVDALLEGTVFDEDVSDRIRTVQNGPDDYEDEIE